MSESIVVVRFNVESEAYQALSEIKASPVAEGSYKAIQGVVVKVENGQIIHKDSFDTGSETHNDTVRGGVIGALLGLLGGPVGVLVGGGIGLFIGSGADSNDSEENDSMIETVSGTLAEGTIAFIVLVNEKEPGSFDGAFVKYETSITRFNSEEILAEVNKAAELKKQAEGEAELPNA